MKCLLLIFSFYFASLAVLPCSDAAASQDNCSTTAEEGHATTDHSSEDSQDELCTPFCSCHCCHVHSVITAGISGNTPFPILMEMKAPLVPIIFSKELFSIWHPPKV